MAAGDGGNGGISGTVASGYFYESNDIDHNGSAGGGRTAGVSCSAEAAGWAAAQAIEPVDALDLLGSVSEVCSGAAALLSLYANVDDYSLSDIPHVC